MLPFCRRPNLETKAFTFDLFVQVEKTCETFIACIYTVQCSPPWCLQTVTIVEETCPACRSQFFNRMRVLKVHYILTNNGMTPRTCRALSYFLTCKFPSFVSVTCFLFVSPSRSIHYPNSSLPSLVLPPVLCVFFVPPFLQWLSDPLSDITCWFSSPLLLLCCSFSTYLWIKISVPVPDHRNCNMLC